ncbi:MAG: ribbon-helix-helix domain-containing protein [Rickettsiales bacterium]|jgi:predicted DNA-binding ribbon-helix-helix protein|nr:ribbon-helix-helix domain-containing protein [Rickettsiales bacterium]
MPKKHSIMLSGHKTSVSLEPEFWDELKKIAAATNTTVGRLMSKLDAESGGGNLSSRVRVFVLDYLKGMR